MGRPTATMTTTAKIASTAGCYDILCACPPNRFSVNKHYIRLRECRAAAQPQSAKRVGGIAHSAVLRAQTANAELRVGAELHCGVGGRAGELRTSTLPHTHRDDNFGSGFCGNLLCWHWRSLCHTYTAVHPKCTVFTFEAHTRV